MTLPRRSFLTLAAGGVAAVALAACGATDDQGAPVEAAPSTPGPGEASTGDTTATTPSPTADTTGTWIVRGPAGRDEVALTFHTDGPTSMVEAVLDIVEGRGLLITSFVVGSWLDANPTMGARLADGGHDLANHTYTHPSPFDALTPAQMDTEIERCREALTRHAGTPGSWFRPSGTDNGIDPPVTATLTAAGTAGYTALGYDVDPIDYRDPGSTAVVDRTLAAVVPGSIVSLHMGHQGTIDALPKLLDGLAAKGLAPVSATQLLRP